MPNELERSPEQIAAGLPKRIQLRRTKGWRMPDNTVKVDRSTKWGNPFVVGEDAVDARDAVIAFDTAVENHLIDYPNPKELKGKNLACWCSEDALWCHADVLLRMANETSADRAAGLSDEPDYLLDQEKGQ